MYIHGWFELNFQQASLAKVFDRCRSKYSYKYTIPWLPHIYIYNIYKMLLNIFEMREGNE